MTRYSCWNPVRLEQKKISLRYPWGDVSPNGPLTEEEIEAVVWWAEILNRDDEKYINSFIRSMIIVGNIPNILNDYRQKDVAKEELIKFKVEVMRKLRYRIRWGGVSEKIKIKKDEYQK